MNPFTVTGHETGGYMSSYAAGATRTQTSIFDTPQTINVLTNQFMTDVQAFTVQNAVRYLANIQPRVNTQGAWRIRGNFVAQSFLNGFPITTNVIGDTANLERVEVIKGTDAVALGQVDPSGSVNRITKPALFDQTLHELTFSYGSFELKRTTIDLGGPLGVSGKFGYRFNAAYTGGGVFQTHDGPGGKDIYNERLLIAPTFGWKINDTTEFHLDVQYDKERDYQPIFTVIETDANGNPLFVIPPTRSPNYNGSYTHPETLDLQAYLVKEFSANWVYRQVFALSKYRAHQLFSVNIGKRVNYRRINDTDWEMEGDLVGRADGAVLKNRFLLGYNFSSSDGYTLLRRKNIKAINYLHPDYTMGYPPIDTIPISSSVDSTSTDLSFFAQDQLAFFDDHLKAMGGFRYERLIAGSYNMGVEQAGTTSSVVAPRFGLMYQPVQNVSLYGLYSSGEQPQRRVRPNGGIIDKPITGSTYEFGVKTMLLNGRADLTFSWYKVDRKNLVNGITLPDGVNDLVASGLQEAKGFELGASGYLTDNWQFLFNGATARTFDNSTNLNHPGSPLGGATDLKLALWNTYKFTGAAKGWEVGFGWVYQSKMHGEDDEYVLPASNVFEARIAYLEKNWQVALNAENVTNTRWFVDAPSYKLAQPGSPRDIRVTFSLEW